VDGIRWTELTREKIAAIPLLRELSGRIAVWEED
jgi:hypothetical protein